MPVISTAACNEDFIALIQGPSDLTLIYSEVTRIITNGTVESMSAPSSEGYDITDHVSRKPDRLSITGYLGCKGCREVTSPVGIIKLLKDAISAVVYTPADFFTITTNRAQYERMIFKGFSVRESKRERQFMHINTRWEGANLAGTIDVPSFEAGGIVG